MDGKGFLGSLNVTSMYRYSNCSYFFLDVYSLRLLTCRDLLLRLDNPSSVWNVMNVLTFLVEVAVVVSLSECIHPTYPQLFCTHVRPIDFLSPLIVSVTHLGCKLWHGLQWKNSVFIKISFQTLKSDLNIYYHPNTRVRSGTRIKGTVRLKMYWLQRSAQEIYKWTKSK